MAVWFLKNPCVTGSQLDEAGGGDRPVMHHDEVPIDLDIARSLIRQQFPQWRDEPVRPVPSAGTVNAIFRIGSGLAARFPLRRQDPTSLATELEDEAAAMSELSEHCPFPSPTPVAIGYPGPFYPLSWSIQSWLPGTNPGPDSHAASTTFALDLHHLIRSLRATPTRGRRFPGSGRGGYLPDHDAWMAECFRESEHLLDVPALRDVWSRFRTLPVAATLVMSHRDLIPPNLLVDGERLTGVLDGGGFAPADPALDLVAAWHHLDRPAREVLRAGLGCPSSEWLRGAAWAFVQAMGLVWYYRGTNPAMSSLGRTTLQRILTDPDVEAAKGA